MKFNLIFSLFAFQIIYIILKKPNKNNNDDAIKFYNFFLYTIIKKKM